MTRYDTTLGNEIDAVIEARPAYKLAEEKKGLSAQQRLEYVVNRLENDRIRIMNSMRELALLLSMIDEDIALLQSIKVRKPKEAELPIN